MNTETKHCESIAKTYDKWEGYYKYDAYDEVELSIKAYYRRDFKNVTEHIKRSVTHVRNAKLCHQLAFCYRTAPRQMEVKAMPVMEVW